MRWQEPGTPAAFVAEEGGRFFFVPLIVRPIPDLIAGVDGWLDATGPRGYPGPIVVEHGESVSIDLARSAEQVWGETRLNHRRAITRALRDGYRVRIDESWQYLDEFVTVYGATMDRLGAAAHWRLPRDYISDLRSTVGARVHLCVVELDSTLAAAALLTEVDGIVEYHLSGASPEHVAGSPTKLHIDQASRWAWEREDRVFHLA